MLTLPTPHPTIALTRQAQRRKNINMYTNAVHRIFGHELLAAIDPS